MGKRVLGTLLLFAFTASGCTSPQLHQSLLMHENRQLEHALYMAQAQTAALKRENDRLRGKKSNAADSLPKGTDDRLLDEEIEIAPPVEMPKIILPSRPGTDEIPESLKGAQNLPAWLPKR